MSRVGRHCGSGTLNVFPLPAVLFDLAFGFLCPFLRLSLWLSLFDFIPVFFWFILSYIFLFFLSLFSLCFSLFYRFVFLFLFVFVSPFFLCAFALSCFYDVILFMQCGCVREFLRFLLFSSFVTLEWIRL